MSRIRPSGKRCQRCLGYRTLDWFDLEAPPELRHVCKLCRSRALQSAAACEAPPDDSLKLAGARVPFPEVGMNIELSALTTSAPTKEEA